MTLDEQRNLISQAIKELYLKSSVKDLFQVSATTHDKMIYRIAYLIFRHNIDNFEKVNNNNLQPHENTGNIIIAVIINFISFIIIFIKYSTIPLLYRLIMRTSQDSLERSANVRFVLLNSAGAVDRMANAIEVNFSDDEYKMLYLFTSFPLKIYERVRKNRNLKFLQPKVPGRHAILGGLYFLRIGRYFAFQLLNCFQNYPLRTRIKVVTSISRYFLSMIIYHHWSTKQAWELSSAYPNAIFVFDLDEDSKELMIADCLNRMGKLTCLIQHGLLLDPNRYFPTCLYMACASEREKKALISKGMDAKRLWVVGQPLQTIKDSEFKSNKNRKLYPLLILAGNGPIWLQKLYVDILRNSKSLKKYDPLFLRLHPSMKNKSKKLWHYNDKIILTDSIQSLGECVQNSQLVITFSIDALVVAVRQARPTIVCIPPKIFVPEWHDFLSFIPMVKVAKTPRMLDEALADKNFRLCQKNDFSESQWENVDHAFGELNTSTNLTTLIHQLAAGIEK